MAEPSYEELRVRLKETEQKLKSRELKLRELGVDDWEPKPVLAEEPVVIKTCNHIRENGRCCRSAAVTGRDYCHFHLGVLGRRLKMARARARGERWRLELPPLEDLYAVQVGIMRVLQALDDDRLDKGRGSLMLYGLQQAATNLRCPQEVWERSCRFDNVEEVQWDSFEQEHGLPKNFDVDTPPEVAFPPAAPTATPATLPSVGAPPLSAAVADRVGTEPDEAAKKDPQRVAAEAEAADKIG